MAPKKAAYYGVKPALQQAAAAAAVTNLGALTAANAAGETPTGEEFNRVVADLNAIHGKLNELLGKMRSAGLLSS